MAIQNPNNLYSGGQVNLDTTPFVKFALQQEAQKKAKDEALDKFFAEKNAKVTTTGMRQQEVEPLLKLNAYAQNFYRDNKDAIVNPKKDGGRAFNKMNELWRNQERVIGESKALNKVNDLVYDIYKDPNKSSLLNEQTLADFDKHQQPAFMADENGQLVSNPNFKPFDVNANMYNPKGYNAKQMADLLEEKKKFTPPDQVKEDIVATNDPYVNKVVTTLGYKEDKLKKIGDESRQEFKSDRDLSWTFNKGHDLIKTPFNQWKQDHVDKFNALNDEYKRIYKTDISNPEDLYVAENINSLKQPTIKEELRPNDAKKQADRVANMYLQDRLIRNRKPDGTVDIESVGFPTDEINKNFGEDVNLLNGTQRVVYLDKIPTTTLNIINPTDVNKQIFAVKPKEIQQPDGSYKKGYFIDENNNLIGKGDKKIGRDDARALYIDKVANTKVKVGFGNKGIITKPSTQNKPTGTNDWKSRAKKIK